MQDKYAKWLQINPLENPKILVPQFPEHQPKRFEEYTEIVDIDDTNVIGFKVQDGQIFLFDYNGCWTDEFGCYYDQKAKPKGWKVYRKVDDQYREYYYDKYGQYVPSDIEDDEEQDDDNDDNNYDDSVSEQRAIEFNQYLDQDQDSIDYDIKAYKMDQYD